VTVAAGTLEIEAERGELTEVDVDTETLWDLPEAAGSAGAYVWIAAEAGVVKSLRRVLRKDLGLPKECGAFMGYWRHGRSAD
jgi:NADPH-dependent ferric siderophore reductase